MIRPRWWLLVPALLASAVLSAASAGEVRDKAELFSPEAVKKAQAELDRFEKEYKVAVTIETINTLDGDTIGEVTTRHAEAVNADGVYILIAKKEAKIKAEASSDYQKYLTRSRFQAVDDAFVAQFKKRDFDGGLEQGVAKLNSVLSDATAEAGGTLRQATTRRGGAAIPARKAPVRKPSSGGFGMTLIFIVGGILAVMLVLRIIGAIFRAMSGGGQYGGGQMMGGRGGYPGQGGPGYGGGGYGGAPAGGGGFMSSMFGGIGGALAGNYLYDQFSGRNHGGGAVDQTGYDAGAAPVEEASPEWGAGGAEAGWGDSAAPDASAGGDWGGGGGGDWGGGGDAGGGDWGGGGGDDNGGSW